MSKNNSQKSLGGDVQAKSQSNGRKTRKRPLKSNITNKVKTRRLEVAAPGKAGGEDDEGDGNDDDAHDDAAEDPDVNALPGAQDPRSGETAKRLAGHDPPELNSVEFVDTMEDVQTADEADEEAILADEDYDDVENVSNGHESSDEDSDDSNDAILGAGMTELVNDFEQYESTNLASIIAENLNFMALTEEQEQALASRLSLQDDSIDLGMPISMDDDPFYGTQGNQLMYNDMWKEAEVGMWGMPDVFRGRLSDELTSANAKRVRFEEIEVNSRSGSESDDPNEAYPDLLDATKAPALQQQLARAIELDERMDRDVFNDTESCYDFEGEDERRAFEIDEESDSDDDTSNDPNNPNNSNSDGGDTTEDESDEEDPAVIEERKRASAEALDRLRKEAEERAAKSKKHKSSKSATSGPTTPKRASKGPRMGTFRIDPSRAIGTTIAGSRKTMLMPPKTPTADDKAFWERALKSANCSRDGSPGNTYIEAPSPITGIEPAPAFTTQSTLGLMFNGSLENMRNNDAHNILDDLFPNFMSTQTSFASATSIADSDQTMQDEINMQDFVDLSSNSSAIDDPLEETLSPSSFDRRGSDLMGHFSQNPGTVGAFRFNQLQAKNISSLPTNPARRAARSEYNALREGKRRAGNTPITPARKKRVSQDITPNGAGIHKNTNSPLNTRRPRSRGNSLRKDSNLEEKALTYMEKMERDLGPAWSQSIGALRD